MIGEMTAEELVTKLGALFGKSLRLPCPANEEGEGEYNLRMIEHFVSFTRYKDMARANLYQSLTGYVARGKKLDYESLPGWPAIPQRYYQ